MSYAIVYLCNVITQRYTLQYIFLICKDNEDYD